MEEFQAFPASYVGMAEGETGEEEEAKVEVEAEAADHAAVCIAMGIEDANESDGSI